MPVAELKPLSTDDIEKAARNAAEDAVDFRDSELSEIRTRTDNYYQGRVTLKAPDGRSKVIVTKVRDGVKSVIPSIARIFTQTDTVAQFYSDDEEDEKMCEDATKYCNAVFWKFGGYQAFIESSIDSLKARVGIMKITVEKKEIPYHKTFETTQPPEVEAIAEQQGAQLTEQSETESVFTALRSRYEWSISCVPPEEFIIDRNATSIPGSFFCAHTRPEKISELIKMGYSFEDLKDIPTYSPPSMNLEKQERNKLLIDKDEGTSTDIDPTSRELLFTEACLRIDADGDGVAELRRLGLVGDDYKLLSDEPLNYHPYAAVKAEFQPHVFYPICLAEDLVGDQDAQTSLLRSIIDNAALVNSPRTEVNENVVNLDDVKNGEIGAIIRVRQMGQINELTTEFVAGQTLPVLQYLDEVSQKRSGITPLSQGLDADALQSTTKIAAAAAVQGSDARIEMMARNIGESGVKELFLCILRTAISTIKEEVSINTGEGYSRVNPSWWHDQVSVRVNVGLGSGRIDEKKMALAQVAQFQQQLITTFGVSNPLCNWNNARNTMADMLRLSGIHTTTAYFPYVPPTQLQQFDQMLKQQSQENQQKQEQAQQMQNKAMLDLVKVEAQKAQLTHESKMAALQQKYQNDMGVLKTQIAKILADNKIKTAEIILTDDRERDKMDMDFVVDVAKVGVDEKKVAATEAKVAAQRTAPNGGSIQ